MQGVIISVWQTSVGTIIVAPPRRGLLNISGWLGHTLPDSAVISGGNFSDFQAGLLAKIGEDLNGMQMSATNITAGDKQQTSSCFRPGQCGGCGATRDYK